MNYREKYICASRAKVRTRRRTPERWLSGPDLIQHDKYYAWQKHRAQAKFRGEPHDLTWDQWDQLWSRERWLERGRGIEQLCLALLDEELGWTITNVQVMTRREWFKIKRRKRNG